MCAAASEPDQAAMAVSVALQLLAPFAFVVVALFVNFFVVPKLRFRNFPGPKVSGPGSFFLGSTADFLRKPSKSPQLFLQFARKYGHIYRLFFLFRPLVVVTAPQDARYILQTKNYPKANTFQVSFLSFLGPESLLVSTGDLHKASRKAIQTGFNAKFLPEVHAATLIEFKAMAEKLDPAALQAKDGNHTLSSSTDVGQLAPSLFIQIIFRFLCGLFAVNTQATYSSKL